MESTDCLGEQMILVMLFFLIVNIAGVVSSELKLEVCWNLSLVQHCAMIERRSTLSEVQTLTNSWEGFE